MNEIEKAKIRAATRGEEKADYLHSSGYAQVASGASMGASSMQSFRERKALEERRKYVRNYRSSWMGSRMNTQPSKPATFEKPTFEKPTNTGASYGGRREAGK